MELKGEYGTAIVFAKIPSGRHAHKHKKYEFDKLKELYVVGRLRDTPRMVKSIGSLGGGNHFIEIGVDSQENKYLVIHSGSRNLGNQVARLYQNLAIDLCNKDRDAKATYPKDLCYLTGDYRNEYLHDMKICQEYASFNRRVMAKIILENLFEKRLSDFFYFEAVHNYIEEILDCIGETVEVIDILRPVYNYKA